MSLVDRQRVSFGLLPDPRTPPTTPTAFMVYRDTWKRYGWDPTGGPKPTQSGRGPSRPVTMSVSGCVCRVGSLQVTLRPFWVGTLLGLVPHHRAESTRTGPDNRCLSSTRMVCDPPLHVTRPPYTSDLCRRSSSESSRLATTRRTGTLREHGVK